MGKHTTDPILLEALEWLVRLRDAQAGDRSAFETWLGQGDAQVAAWSEAQALWTRFDIVQPEIERFRPQHRTGLSRRNVLLGCGAALVGAGALHLAGRGDLFADVTTDVGERRSWTFADGSAVELGSHSALSVDFSSSLRRVRLHRGEGFFDVADDPARPFAVTAADGTTTALGTKFDVKYVDELVTVTASEHGVMVRVGAARAVEVRQGWQVSYGRGEVSGVTRADLASVGAWRQDRIVFQDVPLRRVLAELERYRRGRIILMSESAGSIPVTAVFNTTQPDDALGTIASTLPIRISYATNYLALVHAVW